jgi:hypothetical protein
MTGACGKNGREENNIGRKICRKIDRLEDVYVKLDDNIKMDLIAISEGVG